MENREIVITFNGDVAQTNNFRRNPGEHTSLILNWVHTPEERAVGSSNAGQTC